MEGWREEEWREKQGGKEEREKVRIGGNERVKMGLNEWNRKRNRGEKNKWKGDMKEREKGMKVRKGRNR